MIAHLSSFFLMKYLILPTKKIFIMQQLNDKSVLIVKNKKQVLTQIPFIIFLNEIQGNIIHKIFNERVYFGNKQIFKNSEAR